MLKRPILRYHGGKWMLAPWIISHFPKHRIYVEAFGGGGSVLLRKERSYAEVYNDVWDTVVNVFKIMRDPASALKLKEQIQLTPFARNEFNLAGEEILKNITDPVEKARLTIFRSFAGFGSASINAKHATGFRANAHRNGTTPAQDWVNWPSHIDSFVERLKGVIIENRPYREVCLQHDSTDTLHYLDPPYVHVTRNMKRRNAAYEYELTDNDHIELCNFVKTLKGMVIVSGYHNDIYASGLKDWHVVERKALADGARERTEVLWLNPKCVSSLLNDILDV